MLLRRVGVWKDCFGGFDVDLNIIYYTIEYVGCEVKDGRADGSFSRLVTYIRAALLLLTLPANVMLMFACIEWAFGVFSVYILV